jgi:hypothetical protein
LQKKFTTGSNLNVAGFGKGVKAIRDQTVSLMSKLKNNCDFKNRKGNFINDFYQKIIGGGNKIILIYEFYMKCDTIRFLISYIEDNNSKLELNGFKMEPVEKPNNMIIRKERQLK